MRVSGENREPVWMPLDMQNSLMETGGKAMVSYNLFKMSYYLFCLKLSHCNIIYKCFGIIVNEIICWTKNMTGL